LGPLKVQEFQILFLRKKFFIQIEDTTAIKFIKVVSVNARVKAALNAKDMPIIEKSFEDGATVDVVALAIAKSTFKLIVSFEVIAFVAFLVAA